MLEDIQIVCSRLPSEQKDRVFVLLKRIAYRQWSQALEDVTLIALCKLPFHNLLDQELCFHKVEIHSWLSLSQEDELYFKQCKKVVSTDIYQRKGNYYVHIIFLI